MVGARMAVLCLTLLGTACYHATIETGATPSAETVEKAWASGWIYGLVPPSTVSTAQKCTSGVAKIETQQSFPNLLVHVLTFWLYTPMAIKATCAAKRTASADGPERIRVGVDVAKPDEGMQEAADRARLAGKPVEVEFRTP